LSFGIRDLGGSQPEPLTPAVPYQIEEGEAMFIEVRFDPTSVGSAETRLVATTNAGQFAARLLGDGVA
jgi:hypothetical protein